MTKKILIVDDSAKKRDMTKECLEAIATRVGTDVEVVCFTRVEEFERYLETSPQGVIAVFADNEMYAKYRGAEILAAAQKVLPEATLFWNSSDAPDDSEAEALEKANIRYVNATGFATFGDQAVEFLDLMGGGMFDVPEQRFAALLSVEALLKAESKSALDLARRAGQEGPRQPTDEALRPDDGSLGVRP